MSFLKSMIEARQKDGHAEMSFLEHLEELRRTLVSMGAVALLAMLVCFGFTSSLLGLLRYPVEQIWLEHERQHLPPDVSAQDWVTAKELQAARVGLPPELRDDLERRFSSTVLSLADALDYLRAAATLPPEQQSDFLQRSDAEPLRLSRALHAAGADLHVGQGSSEPRLMGAFQPGEAFLLSVQLAFFGGVILASPILLYLALRFILPGLLEHEKRVLFCSLGWGVFLFLSGCAFAYWAVLPRVLAFFYEYSWSLGIANDWRIGYYLSFAVKLILVFGLIFELPVVLYPLMRFGILTRQRMRFMRPYMLVGSFAAALLLAPAPDPGTMLLMALPLYLLYELCLLFAKDVPRDAQSNSSSV